MARQIVVLSGSIASGKSTLCRHLVERFGFVRFKTSDVLLEGGCAPERAALQRAGANLDRRTKGRWVAEGLTRFVNSEREDAQIIVDSVRIANQIKAIREAFGSIVTHVHLSASPEELAKRYDERASTITELESYAAVRQDRTERAVENLVRIADVRINSERTSAEGVLVRLASHLKLFGNGLERTVDVLVGGQYGSEGKGNIAAYLAPEYDILVRTGGPNAGHKVYREPSPYTFHHLPSGCGNERSEKSTIVLGPGSVIHVPTLQAEIAECQLSHDRLKIDPSAMIIEDQDRERESKGLVGEIGSTGQGVGAASARKILRRLASPKVRLANSISELRPYLSETLEVLEKGYARGAKVFVEGTQGTGLSLHHGSYPYVTSRDTTVASFLSEAGISPMRLRKVIMVCRRYPIRVQNPDGGTSGPIGQEIDWDRVAARSGLDAGELSVAERTSTTKRQRRVAEFDWAQLRRASVLNGPTDVAFTFADYITVKNQKARRFDQLTTESLRFIEEIERVASAPVSLIVTRFNFRCIIDRRNW